MKLSIGIGIQVTCNYCGESMANHASSCPLGKLEDADRRRRFYGCPCCKAAAVDRNDSDYFECRDCHRQFTRCALGDDVGERMYLELDDDFYPVIALPTLGKGIFPSDIFFNNAREQMRRAEIALGARKKRIRRKKRKKRKKK